MHPNDRGCLFYCFLCFTYFFIIFFWPFTALFDRCSGERQEIRRRDTGETCGKRWQAGTWTCTTHTAMQYMVACSTSEPTWCPVFVMLKKKKIYDSLWKMLMSYLMTFRNQIFVTMLTNVWNGTLFEALKEMLS